MYFTPTAQGSIAEYSFSHTHTFSVIDRLPNSTVYCSPFLGAWFENLPLRYMRLVSFFPKHNQGFGEGKERIKKSFGCNFCGSEETCTRTWDRGEDFTIPVSFLVAYSWKYQVSKTANKWTEAVGQEIICLTKISLCFSFNVKERWKHWNFLAREERLRIF